MCNLLLEGDRYRFTVKMGSPRPASAGGTTAGKRKAFRCLMSDSPIDYNYIREEGKAGRMGQKLMAIVALGDRGRIYLSPTQAIEEIAAKARPEWKPEMALPDNPRDLKTPNYGLTTFGDLFSPRQLVALATLSDLVMEGREEVKRAALAAGMSAESGSLDSGAVGADSYADAVAVYLAISIDTEPAQRPTLQTSCGER